MPTPKITFKNFGEKLQQALMRFPLTVTAVLAFAILMICEDNDRSEFVFFLYYSPKESIEII